MEPIVANAIILKQIPFKDHDQIITFLTEDHGKQAGIVRGIKRSNARYGIAFEPLRHISLCYHQKPSASLVAVQRGELLNGFHRIHQSYPKILCGIYLSELVYLIEISNQNSGDFFKWLLSGLLSLDDVTDWKEVKLLWEWHFFELLGIAPELNQCVVCQKQAMNPATITSQTSKDESFFFQVDVSQGGLCCANCQNSPKHLVSLSRGTLKYLISRQTLTEEEWHPTSKNYTEWNQLFRVFFQFHVGRLPKSHALVLSS